jgi:hypothetical protein
MANLVPLCAGLALVKFKYIYSQYSTIKLCQSSYFEL